MPTPERDRIRAVARWQDDGVRTVRMERLRALDDNWVYLARADGAVLAVDPGEAGPVLAALDREPGRLELVLLTHCHADHTGGVAALRAATGCRVAGPAECAACGLDVIVGDGDEVSWSGGPVRVLGVPGHTPGHVAYHAADAAVVWTGDALFAGGCGRPGPAAGAVEALWRSLMRLAGLPGETLVGDGHDYLADNLAFARSVLPGDAAIGARLAAVSGSASPPPTPLALERASNVFLRAGEAAMARAAGLAPGAAPAAVFAALRRLKDAW